MSSKYSVSLEKVIRDHSLEALYLPKAASDLYISSYDVNRPGLILTGYNDYFDPSRVQFLGLTELAFLDSLSPEERAKRVENFMCRQPCAVLITRNLECPDVLRENAQKYAVPLLRTADTTSSFMSALISYLNVELAQRVTRHGVLVDVYGEGVLIFGDSGIGKSETAIELIKRGHRLIADDAVEIKKIADRTLVGTCPELIRYLIELRGIGIINVKELFGVGAVKLKKTIDLVIRLEMWDGTPGTYDRIGLDEEYIDILGNKVLCNTIPIRPGRNVAVICESAAITNRQKKMGTNTAKELEQRILASMQKSEE